MGRGVVDWGRVALWRVLCDFTGMDEDSPVPPPDIFDSARGYDLGINWEARLGREIPVLGEVFGAAGPHGLLDAGCGPGRQLAAMLKAGYRVTGLDRSTDMLAVARERLLAEGLEARLIEGQFESLKTSRERYDGVYCLGNALAATGTAAAFRASMAALADTLVPGGKFFAQLLNFAKLRTEHPAVRGPRVRRDGGREYVSTRVYSFRGDEVDVTNVTLWQDGSWRQFARAGSLYAVSAAEVEAIAGACGLAIAALYGSYAREAFDSRVSNDLIVVARRVA